MKNGFSVTIHSEKSNHSEERKQDCILANFFYVFNRIIKEFYISSYDQKNLTINPDIYRKQ